MEIEGWALQVGTKEGEGGLGAASEMPSQMVA